MSLHFNSFYEVIKNQSDFLPNKTQDLIIALNAVYDKFDELFKKHNPSCLILVNMGQDSFDLTLGFRNKNEELIFLYNDFEFNFNDGNSFGLDNYDLQIPEHPTEDLFYLFRSELLNRLFYFWILEGVWNSNLMKLSIPLVYSATIDCNKLYDIREGWIEYDSFEFLASN